MPALRESTTFVLVRGESWQGEVASEPYEAGWAVEALVFLRPLAIEGDVGGAEVRVQVSPDGMRWVDEGTTIAIAPQIDEVTFARLALFGNWLRLKATLPAGARCEMLATLHLKG